MTAPYTGLKPHELAAFEHDAEPDYFDGNVSIGSLEPSLGGGDKVAFLANRATAPTSNPTGGLVLYSESGVLKYRGASGIQTLTGSASGVTAVGPATGSDPQGLLVSGATINATLSDGMNPGLQTAANFAKAEAAATSVGAVNGTSTATGADLTANVLTLHAADGANAGLQSAAHYTKVNALKIVRWPKTVVSIAGYYTSIPPVTATANRIVFELVSIGPLACKIDQISYQTGPTGGGNVRLAVYGPVVTEDTVAGAPLVCESVSTSQTGVNGALHTVAMVSPPTIQPGNYYLAIFFDSTSCTFARHNNLRFAVGGAQFHDGATYGAFPSTAPNPPSNANTAADMPMMQCRCIP